MSRWWRAYDEAVNDPKLQLLSDAMFRAWFNVLCIASQNDGRLPSIDSVAFTLRTRPDKAAAIIAMLHKAGLLDKTDDGFEPHNWRVRQYKSDASDPTAADRMKRYRSNKRNNRNADRNADRNDTVTVTPPRDRVQNTEAEKKKEPRASALVADDGWPDDFREQFWTRYPNKVGKPKALGKLEAARRRGVAFIEIMTGLESYIASKPPDRSWLNPETFLNQERWADQPAEVAQNARTQVRPPSVVEVARRHAEYFESQSRDGFEGNTGAVLRLPQR